MNAKSYSLSVAKMIAGSKSKKGVKHVAIAVAGTDQFIVVNEAEFLASLTAAKPEAATKRASAKKADRLVTATLPLVSAAPEANNNWLSAMAPDGQVCWFLKSTVTAMDLEARTVTVVIPESKAKSTARKAIAWAAVA